MRKKLSALSIVVVALGVLGGASLAQTGSGAAPAAVPAATDPAPPAPAAPAPSPPSAGAIADAHQACVAALNADPKFEAEIVKIADEKAQQQRDSDTIAAHNDAQLHVQKNERHVIYAYAGMWIVAAAFVIFLWRRQQALKAEIANLRRDLEAAAEGHKPVERPL